MWLITLTLSEALCGPACGSYEFIHYYDIVVFHLAIMLWSCMARFCDFCISLMPVALKGLICGLEIVVYSSYHGHIINYTRMEKQCSLICICHLDFPYKK